jgi:hypothetical protein
LNSYGFGLLLDSSELVPNELAYPNGLLTKIFGGLTPEGIAFDSQSTEWRCL